MNELTELFGDRQAQIWENLSQQVVVDLEEGGIWHGGRVDAKVGKWTVTLDTQMEKTEQDSTSCTRLRAPFINKDGFRFTIYRQSIFSGLAKLLGMQDIEIGDPFFDAEFIIKGNDEQKVKRFLGNERIRELIKRQPDIHLEVRDDEGWFGQDFPEGIDELYFETPVIVRDIKQLKDLFELFGACLHQLCHIGSAYPDDPELKLE